MTIRITIEITTIVGIITRRTIIRKNITFTNQGRELCRTHGATLDGLQCRLRLINDVVLVVVLVPQLGSHDSGILGHSTRMSRPTSGWQRPYCWRYAEHFSSLTE
jgi:hypothetical protein